MVGAPEAPYRVPSLLPAYEGERLVGAPEVPPSQPLWGALDDPFSVPSLLPAYEGERMVGAPEVPPSQPLWGALDDPFSVPSLLPAYEDDRVLGAPEMPLSEHLRGAPDDPLRVPSLLPASEPVWTLVPGEAEGSVPALMPWPVNPVLTLLPGDEPVHTLLPGDEPVHTLLPGNESVPSLVPMEVDDTVLTLVPHDAPAGEVTVLVPARTPQPVMDPTPTPVFVPRVTTREVLTTIVMKCRRPNWLLLAILLTATAVLYSAGADQPWVTRTTEGYSPTGGGGVGDGGVDVGGSVQVALAHARMALGAGNASHGTSHHGHAEVRDALWALRRCYVRMIDVKIGVVGTALLVNSLIS
jgi:hypothetical protein